MLQCSVVQCTHEDLNESELVEILSAVDIVKLHNFVTGASVIEQVAERIIRLQMNYKERYENFRREHFIEQIKKAKRPTFHIPVHHRKVIQARLQNINKHLLRSLLRRRRPMLPERNIFQYQIFWI